MVKTRRYRKHGGAKLSTKVRESRKKVKLLKNTEKKINCT